MENSIPNVNPKEARKEAFSLVIIFVALFGLTAGLFALGWYITGLLSWVRYTGYGLLFLSVLFGLGVLATFLFSIYDWWTDLKACNNRGIEQNQVTSGVPFMPGATKHA